MTIEHTIGVLARRTEDDGSWKPGLYQLGRAEDRNTVAGLLAVGKVTCVRDALEDQLRELVVIRDPTIKASPTTIQERLIVHLGSLRPSEYGTWVHYPWSGELVHVLPADEFREVRSARNRYKITLAEQQVLAEKVIGVVGLSVGQASAVLLAQEGVGRAFRLADFDTLSLSNMNRLRASVGSLGVPKVVLAAREMYAMDPYLALDVWPDGLVEATVDEFLNGRVGAERRIDLLVEECDDLFIKLFVRERAKALRIPTLMDTNERGMMDVERFDLEPDRPVLHGLLPKVKAADLRSLSTRDKVPYVLAILGQEGFSSRFVPSLLEIDETIGSWPQLASGVALGAALVTDVGRRLLLGQIRQSGRYFVDLDDLIQDGRAVAVGPGAPLDAPVSSLCAEDTTLPELPRVSREVSRSDVRRLVSCAVEAPSGGNTQPWRFVARGTTVRCLVDERRPASFLDYQRTATYLAIGAAVENMALAARASGLESVEDVFPNPTDPTLVCSVHLSVNPRPPLETPLAQFISQRVTNRKLGRRTPVHPEHLASLAAAAESVGGRLQLVSDSDGLGALARILGAGDRIRFLSRDLHAEMTSEIRWTPKEVEDTRDGIDIATLELSRTDLAGLRLARSYTNLRFLMEIGGGRALERSAKDSIAACSAVGLITAGGANPASYFVGGRAMQRVWLTATALGLALQPMTSLLYLWTRVFRGRGEGVNPQAIAELRTQRERFAALFDLPANQAEVLLFRLAYAAPPTARSLRRRIDEVLTFEEADEMGSLKDVGG